jgi:hypothetical protein
MKTKQPNTRTEVLPPDPLRKSDPASLCVADEILRRWIAGGEMDRDWAAERIHQEKQGLLAVVTELARHLHEVTAEEVRAGTFTVTMGPDWFGRFRREILHHTGENLLPLVPPAGAGRKGVAR